MLPSSPAPTSVAASYSRYSTDLQQAESITDQQRKCRDHADQLGLTIAPEYEFCDQAISGTKLARDGLDRLLDTARHQRFRVLLLENLSRLARESVISLPILKELVDVLGIRVISISEGLDTDRNGWELPAAIYSLQHERYIKDLGHYVFRGQEGVVLAGFSVGDMCFGYASVPVEGSEANRRGRRPKPRMRYIIDDEQARWVGRIFQWFAIEKRSMRWIARELTRQGAPKDHRATTMAWHPSYVRRVLENPKFVGRWPWGKLANKRNPFSGKVSQTERPAEECDQWVRQLPDLRIIDDALWDAAQRRLAEVGDANRGPRRRTGQLTGTAPDQATPSPRHLLAGLLVCEQCGLTFQVCGPRGEYLGCRGYLTGRCDCETRTPRDRTERMIGQAIVERILNNPLWHRNILDALRDEHQLLGQQRPTRLAEARQLRTDGEQKIARLIDMVEAGSAPPDVRQRIDRRRAELHTLERTIDALERAEATRRPEPTEAWVAEQFRTLETVLAAGGPAAALALRNLVGGRIVMRQIKQPGRRRHYLQARFLIRADAVIRAIDAAEAPQASRRSDGDAIPTEGPAAPIVLDLRELAPWEQIADRAKALWDQGLNNRTIAERLGCHANQVTRAITAWHEQRGLAPPDGRRRWRQMARESGTPTPEPPEPPAKDPGQRSAG
jgi:DNA invertase Pin-like site-specific DNA recombinase